MEENKIPIEYSGSEAGKEGAQNLKKVLKTRDLVIFGLVFMAPVSAQTLFGELTQLSQGHAVLSYLVALIAMIFTASSYGKMAGAFPKAGSTYSYTAQAIHPHIGFIAGWAILLDYLMMPILLTRLSAIFTMELFPVIPLWGMLLVFLVPVTMFNYFGSKVTSRVNLFMTITMIFSLILFITFAVKSLTTGVGGIGSVFSLEGIYNSSTFSMDALISGASIAVLSYLGFDAVTTMAEDSQVTGKMVGKSAIFALLISSFLYICQVYFATLVSPNFNSFQSQDTAFFEVAVSVGGGILATIITIIIAVSGISTALAGQSSGSRILFGMGRDEVLPSIFCHLHPKYKTPDYSIIILAFFGYFGALFLPLSFIFAIMVFGALIGFISVNLSVFVEFFVKRQERSGTSLLFHLVFPFLGVIVCGYILFNMEFIGKVTGVFWVIIGALLLFVRIKILKKEENELSL
ncbi:APC family permease [Halobacillus shinanisalinarum]|uniref:APC family permease n=1 Tax=Halobacillus shinanisalinarum TaxID=2932258 RepID=A0ABY4GWK0_9BACI|nr:APC family permease [Halobacillus shinanisalinarum]UOQ92331.1 APC family permease [Halobacillus shinanisalinarum]